MIVVRFGAFFSDQSKLPNFPPALKVLSVFAKLLEEKVVDKKRAEKEKILTLKLVEYFNTRRTMLTKKTKDYHVAESLLQTELRGIEEIIDNYLDLSLSHRIDFGKERFQRIPVPLKVGRTFKEVANRGFFRVFAETFDRVERQLTNLDFDISFPQVDVIVDLPRLNEFIAWRRIIRLRLIACLLAILNYDRIWKAVDGDAGWWLSYRVSEIADHVTKRLLFQEFERQVYNNNETFLWKNGYKSLLEGIMEIKKINAAAAAWRDHSKVHGCSVSEIGEKYPYEFPKLSQALYFLPGMKEGKFPHMHTRKAAERRLFLVKEYWEFVRQQMLDVGIFDKEKTHYLFSVGAGTLLHGGAHPPHKTHRNGAQFDLDLTYLPDLTTPQALSDAISTNDPFPTEVEAEDDEPTADDLASIRELGPYGLEVPSCVLWRVPSPYKRDAPRYDQECNRPVWRQMIIKFTQCLLLSFPKTIIYASSNLLDTALQNLIKKIEEEIHPAYEAQEDKNTAAALKSMIELWKKVYLYPKRDHHNHWHVNYDPDGLGNENDKIRSINPQLTRQIEQLQIVLHQPDVRNTGTPLWQWLLEDLEIR